jgi:hypothetical protein
VDPDGWQLWLGARNAELSEPSDTETARNLMLQAEKTNPSLALFRMELSEEDNASLPPLPAGKSSYSWENRLVQGWRQQRNPAETGSPSQD